MAEIFSFKCSCCDKTYEGSPSFAFKAPSPYLQQPEKIQKQGQLSSDFCYYEDEDGFHYFIRVVLEIPIHGIAEPFLWGVWVSLSERNYQRYLDTYDEPNSDDCYFGWFCNSLPCYENTQSLKTLVHPRLNNERPYIELEKSKHPLSIDYHQGISIQKAQELAEQSMRTFYKHTH